MNTSILTNKHFVIALIVAPILAVVAWFAVDKAVRPEPMAAKAGAAYPLVAKPNCRYDSGKCALENNEVKVLIEKLDAENKLKLSSNLAYSFARIEFLDASGASLEHILLQQKTAEGDVLATPTSDFNAIKQLRFVIEISGSHYFSETTTEFLTTES